MTGARLVHDTLEQEGWAVEIADAQKPKGLAPLACKTDRIDSKVLAVLSHRDLVPAIWLSDSRVREERELARFRLHLVKHKSALKSRVHSTLINLAGACPVTDLFGAEGRRLLERLGVPEPWRSNVTASVSLIDDLEGQIAELNRRLRCKWRPRGVSERVRCDCGVRSWGGADCVRGGALIVMAAEEASTRGGRWRRWLVWGLAGLAGIVVVAVVLFVVLTRNPSPGSFYAPPAEVPARPGTIIRSEPFAAGIPAGARAWRVLYSSIAEDGRPIAVSGLIVAPAKPPPGPRPVLAWAHGTLGVARPCAPSLSGDPLGGIPDMSGPLARGWVIAMTDYAGLGTPGPHPYLVGVSEGRAVLDSVRAAHRLGAGLQVGDRYAIWGHSQGGQAALFAGQLAPGYLPDYRLAGVAALSPAALLEDNLAAIEGTRAGNVLTIFAVASWSRYYAGIDDAILTGDARGPAQRIAAACLNQPSRFRVVVAGLRLPDRVVDVDVTDDPVWRTRLEQNSPSPDGVRAPLFVAQGRADTLIAPAVTGSWIERRCAAGAPVEYRTYAAVTHPAIVEPGGRDAFTWTTARLAGAPPPDSCAMHTASRGNQAMGTGSK